MALMNSMPASGAFGDVGTTTSTTTASTRTFSAGASSTTTTWSAICTAALRGCRALVEHGGDRPAWASTSTEQGLFVTTPLLLLLLWPVVRPRLHRALWLTTAAVSVPGFFYQNTGWRQFGFRFSLDYTPYLFLPFSPKSEARKMGNWFWALGLIGVAVNVWGALAFNLDGLSQPGGLEKRRWTAGFLELLDQALKRPPDAL